MSEKNAQGVGTTEQKEEIMDEQMNEFLARWREMRRGVSVAEQQVVRVEEEALSQGVTLWIPLVEAAEVLRVTPKTLSVYALGSKESEPILQARGKGLRGIEVTAESLRAEIQRRERDLQETTNRQLVSQGALKAKRVAFEAKREAQLAVFQTLSALGPLEPKVQALYDSVRADLEREEAELLAEENGQA